MRASRRTKARSSSSSAITIRSAIADPHTFFLFGVLAAGASGASAAGAQAGSSTTNVVSDTPSLITSIRPRCASTIWRAIASPRPVPVAFVVKKGWKMRSRMSRGIPLPVLRTVTQAPVRVDDLARDSEPQAGPRRFRREEGLEDALADVQGDTASRIADGYTGPGARRRSGAR